MVCRVCQREYDGVQNRACPHCAKANPAIRSGAVKQSLVLIDHGRTRSVYGSVDEVPEPLRRKLVTSTTGLNSATILIADRRGRDEIGRAIRSLPAHMQGRLSRLILGSVAASTKLPSGLSRTAARVAAVLLGGAASLLVWLAFTHRG